MRGSAPAAAFLVAALLAAAPAARAFEPEPDPAAVERVSGLDVLKPLDPQDLGRLRAGRLPTLTPGVQSPAPTLRLWDEIGRPNRPQPPASQGVVTSTHRGAR
ncbi:hypothetical protein [Neoroseomonas rubea]|uniref:hypothetical protein n=1 Tax=Neoroseomonas rubea TaxID=2748666 RepID=UPI0018DF0522|nr:hypothetical protein [Roseomonas rubea]